MKLIIAEKPQLAQVVAEAIGIVKKQHGYYECRNDYVVTNALGHLLALKMPNEINEHYAKWQFSDLPLKVRPIPLKVIDRCKQQFNIVKQLLSQADTVINAGDPDDEGQLLIDEILDYCQFKGKQERVLINDLDVEEAKKALSNLRPNSEFVGLKNKALARSQADYIVGMNLSRAYSIIAQSKGFQGKLTIGRVQTPVLGLIVRRYLDNKNHKESFYYNLMGNFNVNNQQINAKLVITDNIPTDPTSEKEKRIIDEQVSNDIKAHCIGRNAQINVKIEPKKAQAPLPFSLLDLQVKISNKYGYTSDETLKITQDLREKHKAITYNRSDCRYLNTEQFNKAPETLESLKSVFPELPFNMVNTDKKGRAFNDSKTTAHTAIIPTKAKFNFASFTEKEKNVYREIVLQYLIQFLPEHEYNLATFTAQCEDYQFKTTANKTTNQGWTCLIKDEEIDEIDNDKYTQLENLSNHNNGICLDVEIKKEKTKPLPIYTEATLLKDLQNVAKYVKDPMIKHLLIEKDKEKSGENGGIGTPATRSAIIKGLNEKGYFEYQSKKIIPTQIGIDFIQSLPEILTYPDMTALWFEQQVMIEKGELTVNQFLDGIDNFIIEQLKQSQSINIDNIEQKGEPCPKCKKGVMVLRKNKDTGRSYFACSDSQCRTYLALLNGNPIPNCPCCNGILKSTEKVISCECGFILWRTFFGKMLTDSQIFNLLTKGKTPLIKGLKSKSGKEFEAYAKLNKADKKVEPDFPPKN